MKIFFLVVATTYILYLLFLIVRACSELRNMPYVGKYFWGFLTKQAVVFYTKV